jgi:hypothetical protein
MEHFVKLFSGQTGSKNITENNYTTENSNIPHKMEVSILNLKTTIRQMKNNKSLVYHKLSINMIKAAGPIRT